MVTVSDRYSPAEIADYYDKRVWLRDSFFDMISLQSATRGSSVFVIDDSRQLTFSEYHDEVVRLASGLRKLNVQRGDRVAVQLPNWVEFAVVSAAVARLGAIIVPIMPIYRDDEVEYILEHCTAKFAVTCERWKGFSHRLMFEKLRSRSNSLQHVVVVRPEGTSFDAGTSPFQQHLVDGEVADLLATMGPDTDPDHGFLIVYTSGTTARPKGCFHTLNTVRASAIAMEHSLGIDTRDVLFGPSPITHSTGLMTSVILPLLAGAQSYLMAEWTPRRGVEKAEQHRCTVTVTATAFLQMFLGALEENGGTPTLRQWVCAGSPIPGAVVERARRELAGCQILSLYGRSESFLNAMCASDDDADLSSSTDGRPRGGAELRVVDAKGHELPRGEVGDISYRGPSHMLEYFRDSAQTAALAASDGFARSGDLGYMTDAGYVRVTGRIKDIVIRGGLNISARELEDHLIDHPLVDDVAVVGMPDERLGEKVCAFIIAKSTAGAPGLAELVEFLRSRRVATPKLPQRLEVVETFPVTATGKIKKHELRQSISKKLQAEAEIAENVAPSTRTA